MQHINLITRRGFMDRSMKIGMAAALGSLVNLPLVLKRALAEGTIGAAFHIVIPDRAVELEARRNERARA